MFKNFTFRYRCNINDVVTDVTAVLQIRMKYIGMELQYNKIKTCYLSQ